MEGKMCPLFKDVCMREECQWWVKLSGKAEYTGVFDYKNCCIPALVFVKDRSIKELYVSR